MVYFALQALLIGILLFDVHAIGSVPRKPGKANFVTISSAAEKTKSVDKVEKKRFAFLPDGVKDGIASGLAAAVVKAILQPLDTIKTVQQAQNSVKLGPIRAAVDIVEKRGIAGLWSGLGITVIGSSPSVAVYFGLYSSCKTHLTKVFPANLKLVAVAISATIGNSFASILRAPYEVLKQRVQNGNQKTAWEALQYLLKTEGPLGLFSGGKLASQIVRDVPYAIVTLVSYEVLQALLVKVAIAYKNKSNEQKRLQDLQSENSDDNSSSIKKKSNSAAASGNKVNNCVSSSGTLLDNKKLTDALCGAIAGGLGSLATTPMDVVKTRMMTSAQYSSIWDATVRILKEEGPLTFFVGTVPRLMHKIPANGLFFLCYEAFRAFLGVRSTGAAAAEKAAAKANAQKK